MHNRDVAHYDDFVAELLADLRAALDRAQGIGVPRGNLIVDPGFGFGKTPEHNLEVMRHLRELRELGSPVLLGTSRKSTLGRVLGELRPRIARGDPGHHRHRHRRRVDIVRVHDVLANVRAARMSDAVVRGVVL